MGVLEAASRAVAKANGFEYSGESIIENAEDNPRAAKFVDVAKAVLAALDQEAVYHVVKRVAELPDRSSPDDWPEAMLVTAEELRDIVRDVIVNPED